MHRKKYIFAIIIALLVLLIKQGFIQYFMSLKKQDAYLINTAGKQRMFSQKIIHEYEHWYITGIPSNQINPLYDEWKAKNEQLLNFSLEKQDDNMVVLQNLNRIIENQASLLKSFPTKQNIEALNSSMEYFLTSMDDVVLNIQQKSDFKLNQIRKIELLLFSLSLIVLFMEVIFIFRPLFQTLEKKSKALQASYKDLARKKHELEQLTYAISHDLKEPITMFQSLINRYIKKKEQDGIVIREEMIEHLNYRVTKADKLLSNLLIYTEERGTHSKELFDLVELVEVVTKKHNFQEYINSSKLKNFRIYGYKPDISLVLEHLIINAVTYQSEDRLLNVQIHQEIKDNFCVIKVKDNGKGIAQHKINSVFNLFKSGEKQNSKQTGFGLAFCKKIIEEHGGKIGVHSRLNEGTEFYFHLPLPS